MSRIKLIGYISLISFISLVSLTGCYREPYLHLPGDPRDIEIPLVDLRLEAYWDYELSYDWRAEWIYGWALEDQIGILGYTDPKGFNVRRYYTHKVQYGPHTNAISNTIKGSTLHCEFDFGFWDILVWNEIEPVNDDVQNLNFNESLDSISAYTNADPFRGAPYHAPRYTRAFYQPEQLFSAYERGLEINESLDGFDYDPERNIYVKKLNMVLEPITYIYLTQVVLHHNNNKVIGVDGYADLSGVARSTNVNTGVADDDPATVEYKTYFSSSVTVPNTNEVVAVAGGRLMTFGIPNQNGNRIKHVSEVNDKYKHYLDIDLVFNNGMDSTLVFDVTDQIRKRWKGGVITVELDMENVPIPRRSGGSAFNAIVKDYEYVEFEPFDL